MLRLSASTKPSLNTQSFSLGQPKRGFAALHSNSSEPSFELRVSWAVPMPSKPQLALQEKWNSIYSKCNVYLTSLEPIMLYHQLPVDCPPHLPPHQAGSLVGHDHVANSYPEFTHQLHLTFNHLDSKVEMDTHLYHLRKGIHHYSACQSGIGLEALSQPVHVTAIDGWLLTTSPTTHLILSLLLTISDRTETLEFLVTSV